MKCILFSLQEPEKINNFNIFYRGKCLGFPVTSRGPVRQFQLLAENKESGFTRKRPLYISFSLSEVIGSIADPHPHSVRTFLLSVCAAYIKRREMLKASLQNG